MEFADGRCYLCGAEVGDKEPEKITRVKPYSVDKRVVDYVGPCPSCGKDIPLWAGPSGDVPTLEPGATITVGGKAKKAMPPTEPEP